MFRYHCSKGRSTQVLALKIIKSTPLAATLAFILTISGKFLQRLECDVIMFVLWNSKKNADSLVRHKGGDHSVSLVARLEMLVKQPLPHPTPLLAKRTCAVRPRQSV